MRPPPVIALVALLVVAAPASAGPGDLDRSFGRNGEVRTFKVDGAQAALRTRDGRIVVGGGSGRASVVRLRSGGRLDRTFGGDGVVAARRMSAFSIFGIRRGPDGVFRLAGDALFGDTAPISVLRATARRPPVVRRHRVPLEGPIVAGDVRRDGGAFALARRGRVRSVLPDGGLDTRFGGDGTVNVCALLSARRCTFSTLLVRPSGRVVLGGTVEGARVVAQLTRRGALDPSFGRGGLARTGGVFPEAMRVAPGGDLLVATGTYRVFARVTRLSPAGRVRRRFGRRGPAIASAKPEFISTVMDVVSDRRGRVYVLAEDESRRSTLLAFDRRGRLVRRFGRDGRARLPRPRGHRFNLGRRLLLGPRRTLVVAGTHAVGARYTPADLGGDCFVAVREDLCAQAAAVAVWRLGRL